MKYIILLTLILNSCSSVQYFEEFKKQKKEINEITILRPIVSIVEKSKNYLENNPEIENQNLIIIDSVTNQLLEKRYEKIESIDLEYSNLNKLDELLSELDNNESNRTISFEKIFQESKINTDNEYAILIIYKGRYNPKFPPHFRTTSTMSGMLILTPGEKMTSNSDMRMIVLNTKNKNVVLHEKINTIKFDPRVEKEVTQLTKTILKKMYYK